jgi:chromosomal replication initiation ATPase DnaA
MTIIEAIAKKYGIPEDSIYQKSKKRKVSEPRMLAIAMLVSSGEFKQKDMVPMFNLKPPAVSLAISSVRCLVRYNHDFRSKVVEILVLISDCKEHREHVIEQLMSLRTR